jgi:folate-binding Fe-S cluster repair protein YgfZ
VLFALDAGLDELHAIAFDKGCYIGQELTARMKHRGTDRKRLLFVTSNAPLTTAASVTAAEIMLGEITAVYGLCGFALIRLDRLAEASAPLEAAGQAVTLVKQSWL